jgi:hypothetical protein
LFRIDLYRLAAGLPGSSGAIPLWVPAEDDIAFDVQHRVAAIHLQGGQVSLMHYQGATVDRPLEGLPPVARQLYAHPFRNTFSYASTDGRVVTIDRGTPYVDNTVPVEGMDFTPPPALDISRVHEADYRAGDLPGVVNFEMDVGAAEPGAIIQAVNRTNANRAAAGLEGIIEPVADVAEGDGSAEISVVADSGEVVCFKLYDASGNASEEVCYTVSTVDAPGPSLPTQIAFTMAGANPVRGEARFHLALPQAATVDLTLFDVAGRRVATLARGEYPAGDHVLVWDPGAAAPRVSSGIYFVRFRAAGYSETKRLVLIR